jgi:hypothetical protein
MQISRRLFHRSVLGGATCIFLQRYSAIAAASRPGVELQPFLAQVRRLLIALDAIGEPLPKAEVAELNVAFATSDEIQAIEKIQTVLDRHVLVNVEINPEARISVSRGHASAELLEQGWRSFLIKVSNRAASTFVLQFDSPQGRPVGRRSTGATIGSHDFTIGSVDPMEALDRWVAINAWDKPPLQPSLSGLEVEYRILQIYSRDQGRREATLEARAEHGKQDLGFRSSLSILFDCLPSNELVFRVRDVDGTPATASLLIKDSLNRIYPAQGKRALPDLWFEPHIYRRDGETLRLPAGQYFIEYGRGPEYLRKKLSICIQSNGPTPVDLPLERWVQPNRFGYYSGDTHIHAAGCSHYESPYEGVTPEIMFRQVQGEALDVGDVLNWGPGFYYQKQFFRGHVDHISPSNAGEQEDKARSSLDVAAKSPILRYDIEVSGFPSSHCGHLVLLRLADQNYPGANTIAEWPSWNMPILKWAKGQGGVVGYAHAGEGLSVDSTDLPNYLIPQFDNDGTNEYLVDITHDNLVDFISGCDTWPFVELNIWYHTLNCGFRTSFAGETDFPCITDECVGGGRSYVKLDSRPTGDAGYDEWVLGVRAGRSYVGDGRSHIFHFTVEHAGKLGTANELRLDEPGIVRVTAEVCARLNPEITEWTEGIRTASPYDDPCWHLERARLKGTRKVPIELIVNGLPVERREIEADGIVRPIEFHTTINRSSWIGLRFLPSSHTNPMFVVVAAAPVRASRASAEWCRKSIDVVWQQKSRRIRTAELDEARVAFEHARSTYDRIITECPVEFPTRS